MPSPLPYHEPSIPQLLSLSSFIYFLNLARELFNFVHAGIVGEIAMGIVYGTPLTGVISLQLEQALSIFGYIGLTIILFQGEYSRCN